MDPIKKYFDQYQDKLPLQEPTDAIKHSIFRAIENKNVRRRGIYTLLSAGSFIGVVLLSVWLLMNESLPVKSDMSLESEKKPVVTNIDANQVPKLILEEEAAVVAKYDSLETNEIKQNLSIQNNKRGGGINEADVFAGDFINMIETQKQAISAIAVYAPKPGYFNSYYEQFQVLNSEEEKFATLVKSFGMNKIYLNALIDVYHNKMDLLITLQLDIYKLNARVFKDSIGTSSPYFVKL